MPRNIFRYVTLLLIFGTGIIAALRIGTHIYSNPVGLENPSSQSAQFSGVSAAKAEPASPSRLTNSQHPIRVLLLQIVIILISAKLSGILFHRLFKVRVVGEMIAGILLGPSVLGSLSPGTMHFLFPVQSLDFLSLLSQLGVILFMFMVGTELNLQHLRDNAHASILVSHAGIIIPFFLGVVLSVLSYRYLAPPHISFHAFALFMSVCMSITAFPVLARIIEERHLSASYIGSTAIACAAVDDATAWCLLTVVVAMVRASGLREAGVTILMTLVFIGVMLLLVKPKWGRIISNELDRIPQKRGLVEVVLIFAFVSALITEVIGIHALFGAFVAGVALPAHPRLRLLLTERLQVLTTSFLLPLYFAFTGLRTQIGLLNDWSGWLMCALVVVIAIAGKLGGVSLAARLTGMSGYDSLTLGVLMNTRGLVELIVLNIGYDLGILNPKVYAMMVLMALITTFMTGPLLSLLEFLQRQQLVFQAHSK